MIKLLMKYLLFAGVMAVVGCTEEKMEEVFIEQPNSFHIKVEGDEAFALEKSVLMVKRYKSCQKGWLVYMKCLPRKNIRYTIL